MALTAEPEALGVLSASTVEVSKLQADIAAHLAKLPRDGTPGAAILPNNDLLKVLRLASMAAQQSSRRHIDGAIVLAAIIGDGTTSSAAMLKAHGLTFGEVIRVLQSGVKPAGPAVAAPPPQPALPPVSTVLPAAPAAPPAPPAAAVVAAPPVPPPAPPAPPVAVAPPKPVAAVPPPKPAAVVPTPPLPSIPVSPAADVAAVAVAPAVPASATSAAQGHG